jgi:hypothetical protein
MGPVERSGRVCAVALCIGIVMFVGLGRAKANTPLAPRVPSLAGVSVISASHTGFVTVNVPKRATISTGDFYTNKDVSFRGPGRVVSLILVQDARPWASAATFHVTRWTFCTGVGCDAPDGIVSADGTVPTDANYDSFIIAPGRYRLYLVVDGGPLAVSLRLHGLSGRANLRPTTAATAYTGPPQQETYDSVTHEYVATAKVQLPGDGLMLEGFSAGGQLGVEMAVSCYHLEGAAPVSADPLGAGGPTLQKDCTAFGPGQSTSTNLQWNVYVFSGRNVNGGTWDAVYQDSHAGVAQKTVFMNLWLSYS